MVKVQNTITIVEEGDSLTDILDRTVPSILYFTAKWCGPCKSIYPFYVDLQEKYPNIKFYKIDIDDCEEIASNFNIQSVPTFYLYKTNDEYFKTCQGADKELLSSLVYSLNETYKPSNGEIEPLINHTKTQSYNTNTTEYTILETPKDDDLSKFFETIDMDQDVTDW